MLIVMSGLPGVGKTTIAQDLARRLPAVHLRIDSIEQALRDSGAVAGPMNDAGYRAAYALAEDNLRLGHTVIADSVNPIQITRDAWLDVAKRAKVPAVEIEIRCSDPAEHRRRAETRPGDIAGLKLPTWDEIVARKYEPWDREHLTLDTTTHSIEESIAAIVEILDKPHIEP